MFHMKIAILGVSTKWENTEEIHDVSGGVSE